jgi:ParB-like chromosome segregation protein Spo0J
MGEQHMNPTPRSSFQGDRFHPIANLFPLMDGELLNALVVDIRANGLREPIVEFEGLILDGRNRYEACRRANCEPRLEPFEGDDPLAFVLSKNLHRRHLNESQRAIIMARIATLGRGGDRSNPPRGVLQPDAAKALQVGVRTGQRAKVVLERGVPELVCPGVATLAPEVQNKLVTEPLAKLRGALKAVTRAQRERQLAASAAEASLARGRTLYSVIYADPPWRFEPYSRESGLDRAADNHYPTLDIEAIRDIRPPAAADCALFLWATVPMLPEAMRVVEAWGFTYKSHFVWGKDRAGTGYWNRNKHELLLIATKGNVPAPPRVSNLKA